MIYIKNNLIDSDSNMSWMIDSLIGKNSIITGSNKITLTKVHVKTYGFDNMYMDKDLIEDKLY